MSSYVYYKFRSQRAEKRIAFDGTGISVFDLKKEIILSNNFGKASEMDLLLFDSADKEYIDDNQIIPRSTSVIAKRMPASKPGRGKAAMYIAGTGPSAGSSVRQDPKAAAAQPVWNKSTGGAISKRFDGKEEKPRVPSFSKPSTDPGPSTQATSSSAESKTKVESNVADDEAERIKAMFQANDEHWKETQERMSHVTPIYSNNRGGAPRRPFQPSPNPRSFESKPLPPGYICHRCSKPGHWIQDCPTNDDRDYDNRPRIKRTTGIPRSFLKAVEAPEGAAQGIMVTPEGGFVIAQPDVASWEKQRSRPTPLTAADVREKAPSDATLACPICSKLLRDAVKTPCCSKTFDEECIQTHLLESDFICPSCHKKVVSLDTVTPDFASRERVRKYIEDEIVKSVGPVDSERNTPDAPSTSKLTTQGKAVTSDASPNNDPEITFDSQPGTSAHDHSGHSGMYNVNVGGGNPLDSEIKSIESQIQHVMMMMSNPQLTPQMRMQFQMQLPSLTIQLNHLQQMSLYGGDPYMNVGGMGMAAAAMGVPGGQGGYNNMYADGMGYGAQGYSSGHVFNNPGLLSDADSPYQRVAPNNRRRTQKRDRPEDFVNVNGNGQKYPRYYE